MYIIFNMEFALQTSELEIAALSGRRTKVAVIAEIPIISP
jgi:hypothetical protein